MGRSGNPVPVLKPLVRRQRGVRAGPAARGQGTLVVHRVELRVLLVADHHRMRRRGLRRRVPHTQHRV
eukprot:4559583-Prymnesium_polylepis.1